MQLGILSDTHDRPHPRLYSLFGGVDHILHAGDVCMRAILTELEVLAPVQAVHGNCCTHELQHALPAQTLVELGGWRILMQHDIGRPAAFCATLPDLFPAHALPHVVLSGHSHVPLWERHDDVWFLNPGSAGPARFRSRPHAAILTLNGSDLPAVDMYALDEC